MQGEPALDQGTDISPHLCGTDSGDLPVKGQGPEHTDAETGPQDVSTLMASAKGTAMHNGLTAALQAYDPNYTCEKRIEREVEGWKISGEFDVLTPDKQIKDYAKANNVSYAEAAAVVMAG